MPSASDRVRAAGRRLLAAAALAAVPTPAAAQSEGHGILRALVGTWQVRIDGAPAGRAVGRPRLDGRFVEVELELERGPLRRVLYLFGFDGRHGEYNVLAMDDSDTYWITARGTRAGEVIRMEGSDRDPNLAALGLTKEFLIVLTRAGPDTFRLDTRFIDTRTPARTEIPFLSFELTRGG